MNIIYQTAIQALLFIATAFTVSPSLPSMAVDIEASTNMVSDSADYPDIFQGGKYDVMLDSVNGPLTYYNQGDIRWRDYLYGGQDPLHTYGCGPTVMAMLITSLTGNQVLPAEVADWAAANKCWCPGQGSYHCLIPDSAAAYSLTSVPLRDYTAEGLKKALDSGHLIVALMKKGHFTQQGHFIIITRFTPEGTLRIADSNNFENVKNDWDPSIILSELNHHASNGGPLWMISLSGTQ